MSDYFEASKRTRNSSLKTQRQASGTWKTCRFRYKTNLISCIEDSWLIPRDISYRWTPFFKRLTRWCSINSMCCIGISRIQSLSLWLFDPSRILQTTVRIRRNRSILSSISRKSSSKLSSRESRLFLKSIHRVTPSHGRSNDNIFIFLLYKSTNIVCFDMIEEWILSLLFCFLLIYFICIVNDAGAHTSKKSVFLAKRIRDNWTLRYQRRTKQWKEFYKIWIDNSRRQVTFISEVMKWTRHVGIRDLRSLSSWLRIISRVTWTWKTTIEPIRRKFGDQLIWLSLPFTGRIPML